jgi:hypothetical protein
MVATRAHDTRLTKRWRYEVCQWHGGMYALATAAESGMKAGKRKSKSGMPTRNTHTLGDKTEPLLNSTIKHGNGACVVHTTAVCVPLHTTISITQSISPELPWP